eukprot:5033477-Amphidinium_carterae.1
MSLACMYAVSGDGAGCISLQNIGHVKWERAASNNLVSSCTWRQDTSSASTLHHMRSVVSLGTPTQTHGYALAQLLLGGCIAYLPGRCLTMWTLQCLRLSDARGGRSVCGVAESVHRSCTQEFSPTLKAEEAKAQAQDLLWRPFRHLAN